LASSRSCIPNSYCAICKYKYVIVKYLRIWSTYLN